MPANVHWGKVWRARTWTLVARYAEVKKITIGNFFISPEIFPQPTTRIPHINISPCSTLALPAAVLLQHLLSSNNWTSSYHIQQRICYLCVAWILFFRENVKLWRKKITVPTYIGTCEHGHSTFVASPILDQGGVLILSPLMTNLDIPLAYVTLADPPPLTPPPPQYIF